MTKMICLATIPVKPNRRTSVPAGHRFGQGILQSRPHVSTPYTASEAAEAAAMFAEAKPVTMTFDALMSQIKTDLVRIAEIGKLQDDLMSRIQMSKLGVRPISGGAPSRFVPSKQDLEDVFGSPSCNDDAHYLNAAG